ncbi:hypothetical protein D3C78_1823060 [compost metagenome]
MRELTTEQEMDVDFRIVKGEIDALQSQYNDYRDQIDSLNKRLDLLSKIIMYLLKLTIL